MRRQPLKRGWWASCLISTLVCTLAFLILPGAMLADKPGTIDIVGLLKHCRAALAEAPAERRETCLVAYRAALYESINPCRSAGQKSTEMVDEPAMQLRLFEAKKDVLAVLDTFPDQLPEERTKWLRLALAVHAAMHDIAGVERYSRQYATALLDASEKATYGQTVLRDVAICHKENWNIEGTVR